MVADPLLTWSWNVLARKTLTMTVILLNAAQRRVLGKQQAKYDKLDNIAYSDLMKACRLNPKTK